MFSDYVSTMKQPIEYDLNSTSVATETIENSDVKTKTSSSIIEFLNNERECLQLVENDSEVDIDSIFEEINRLSDESDERSVDEILREAELLLSKQQQIESDLNPCDSNYLDENETDKRTVVQLIEPIDWHSGLETISEKSTPPITKSQSSECPNTTVLQPNNALESSQYECLSLDKQDETESLSINFVELKESEVSPTVERRVSDEVLEIEIPEEKVVLIADENQLQESPKSVQDYVLPLPLLSKPRSSRSPSMATLHSPTIPRVTSISASNSFSWSRERVLEQQIEILREKLMDTEERLQSLRMQYDNLSQVHRTLRDSNHHLNDEMDRLKIDAQHLHECANILRTELQAARKDRFEAIEIQEKLQRELEIARDDKRRIAKDSESNSKQIMDLQRQCKEMERILARKNPDAIQILLGSKKGNDDQAKLVAARRQLEQRIAQLENDAREQDNKAQLILANVQSRFSSVQSKYETHISDLETQVLSLQQINQVLNEKIESQTKFRSNYNDYMIDKQSCAVQTNPFEFVKHTTNNSTQTDYKSPSASPVVAKPAMKKPSKQTTPAKEDSHLLATVRGMRVDLAIKEKALQRLTREVDECRKTIRKLQKDNENARMEKAKKAVDQVSNADQVKSPNQLVEKIRSLEMDYKTLQEKRLQDLKILQSAHERELNANKETVHLLEQRLAEREEAFAIIKKHNKIPIDYFALKAKVSSLERRHTEREQRLHILVEALSKGRLTSSFDQTMSETAG